MLTFPEPSFGRLLLVTADSAGLRASQPAWIGGLALNGPVHILDCGNCFDAFGVARWLRRSTPQVHTILERIFISRAFTCYQVMALLVQSPADGVPTLVLDLLVTFADESVRASERGQLLNKSILQLKRLRRSSSLAVSVSLQSVQEVSWLQRLEKAADQIWRPEPGPSPTPAYQLL